MSATRLQDRRENGGGLANLFSTHPPMEERVARLEQLASAGLRL